MKTIKLEVSVSTCYRGSEVSKILEIEVEDDATEKEIEDLCNEEAIFWLYENINFNYSVIE